MIQILKYTFMYLVLFNSHYKEIAIINLSLQT